MVFLASLFGCFQTCRDTRRYTAHVHVLCSAPISFHRRLREGQLEQGSDEHIFERRHRVLVLSTHIFEIATTPRTQQEFSYLRGFVCFRIVRSHFTQNKPSKSTIVIALEHCCRRRRRRRPSCQSVSFTQKQNDDCKHVATLEQRVKHKHFHTHKHQRAKGLPLDIRRTQYEK